MMVFSVRCRRSTRPLAAVCCVGVLWRCEKAGTRTGVFNRWWLSGQLKWDIHVESSARDTVSDVMSGLGKVSGHRVKRSPAVRQYWNPAADGRGPTSSIWMCKNEQEGEEIPTGVMVWLETSGRWRGWQTWAQVRQSFWMTGHMKRWETSSAVALIPRWLSECRELNNWQRKGNGTYRRGLP